MQELLLGRKKSIETTARQPLLSQASVRMSRDTKKLPKSLPDHWPSPSDADLQAKPKRIITVGGDQNFLFNSNFVKTSKYETYNFIPKFLWEEFNPRTKVANCYFLLIAGMQCIPEISNTGGYPTTLIPLTFVVVVDAFFQIIEDIARHRSDNEANAAPAYKFDFASHLFVEVRRFELEVGDFIKVNSRDTIPADIVCLAAAETTTPARGICYIETKSLDGETNLKIRNALPSTMAMMNHEVNLPNLKGSVEMEHPNKLIDSFSGVALFDGVGKEPIMPNNVLLRGCVLRNTEFVIGLVVNTGHDTKIMMSSTATKAKSSNLEVQASNQIINIIIMLAFLCFWGATGMSIWNDYVGVSNLWYLHWNPSPVGYWFVKFFYFFLLHASYIPVSLYVSMAAARFLQARFINSDLEMYYEPTDTPALTRTMTLNEELGQISHIFSDKTGTLTCNVMDFRKASINGVSYGVGITEIGKASWKLQGKDIPQDMLDGEAMAKARAVPHVSFYDPIYEKHRVEGGAQNDKINQFFKIICLCHDVIPERVDGKVKLSASNPDDEALVCAAAYFGFEFCDRKDKMVVFFNKTLGRTEEVELLESIEFSSKRKRMSVIVRDTDNIIRLFIKGADSVMMERFQSNQDSIMSKTDNDMRIYAIEGLRCLLVGYAEITEERYSSWNNQYRAATTDLDEIEKLKKGQPNDIERLQDEIERNIVLVGATAIEDRLQDGVPECIAELAKAGINIWVLTGDKEETAINIAVACNLVLPEKYMDQIIINKTTAPTKQAMLSILKEQSDKLDKELSLVGEKAKPRALIIDGPSLITALVPDEYPGGLRSTLLEFSKKCRAVVGCRVSPDQKRQMVNLIKVGVPGVRTLAVGDGANDVAMIQEAHVGVGIKGEEGIQAVNAADFAIAQFRFLSPLILKHGRYNYIRMSGLICIMFYKNILMSTCHFWFNFNNGFSGQKYFTEAAIQMFNVLFTAFPLILYAVYDQDISPAMVHKYPQIYQAGINSEFFNFRVFWNWLAHALLESVFLSVLPMYEMLGGDIRGDTHWGPGALCFTAVVIIANLKMFFLQTQWMPVHFAILFLSVLLWFLVAFTVTSFTLLDFEFFNVWNRLMISGPFWLTLFVLSLTVFTKDLICAAYMRFYFPSHVHIIQEKELVEYKHLATHGEAILLHA